MRQPDESWSRAMSCRNNAFKMVRKAGLIASILFSTVPLTTLAANAATDAETSFIFNTFSLLIHGALVFWMAAGFAMLEAGMVRSKKRSYYIAEEHFTIFDFEHRVLCPWL